MNSDLHTLGSGGMSDSRPLGTPAQQSGVCKHLSFQVPGPGPASVLSATRAVCAELASTHKNVQGDIGQVIQ